MGLLSRVRDFASSLEPQPARSSLSVNDWINMFQYNGVGYPFTQSLTYGDRIEEPDPSFTGYVQGAYKSNGVVFACIVARMLLFSEARFQFRQLRSGRPGDLFGSQALGPLEKPWRNGTTGDLLSRCILDADLAGNFYAVRRGQTVKRLRPDWVSIVLGSDLDPDDPGLASDAEVIGYVYKPGGYYGTAEAEVLLPEQVAHFAPLPDPEARFRGMSWLSPVIREIMADQAATQHSLRFFEKGATPNLAVTSDPTVTAANWKAFVDMFKHEQPELVDAYRTVFMGGGAKIEVIGSTMQEVDFKSTRGSGETRICMAARVPPIIVGASEGLDSATYSNYGQARRAFSDLTMAPLWRQMCAAFAPIIDVPGGAELWYDDRDIKFLQEDEKDAAEILEIQSRTIKGLTESGFDPDSTRDAVVAGDLKQLKHTGLLSVQMQAPGATAPQVPKNGQMALPIGNGNPARAELVERVSELAREDQDGTRD